MSLVVTLPVFKRGVASIEIIIRAKSDDRRLGFGFDARARDETVTVHSANITIVVTILSI